jgi:cell division septal protein FtsQ
MPSDPIESFAESFRITAETQQMLAQTQLRMEETNRHIAQTQRLGVRLQAFALVLIGLSLLFIGVVVWQHVAMRHESAALEQAVLTNTQTIAAQTQALLERLGPR